jgi:hypothetical protein
MDFLVHHGEPLPQTAESSFLTVMDNQSAMEMDLYQGDHYLVKLNDLIGKAELEGLPPVPRGQCSAAIHIEYDCDGILQFSAQEKSTGKSINATFTTRTEFTDDDHARLTHTSALSRLEEMREASLKWLREMIRLDIVHAESQSERPELVEATKRWREWYEAHEDGEVRMFEEKYHELQSEFHAIYPDQWEEPTPLREDHQFSVIWPIEPLFTDQGAAIIRFLTLADFPKITFTITNDATKDVTRDFEISQFPHGDKIETISRVCFPENGRYTAMAFAGRAGETELTRLSEMVCSSTEWKSDVQGAPAPPRPLIRLLTDRPVPPLECIEELQVEPGGSCVKSADRVYRFKCRFRGGDLGINGREPVGEPEQTFFPDEVVEPCGDGWSIAQCSIEFPAEGIWRLLFWIDHKFAGRQIVLVGSGGVLKPTSVERAAFNAPLPILES